MGNNDDFLVPGNVDLSLSCDIDQAVLHKDTVLRLFACLSIASYLYLFWMYFVVRTPVLKRHPTRLAIYGCIIEMGYFQQYLWLPTVGKDYLYSDDAMMEPYYCNSSRAASGWAFVTQFCMIGVQLCFLAISVDLRLAYTNPFSSYKHNKFYFASFVILGALFTSLCLLAMGPRVYGYDEHGVVWIQDSRASLAMNWPKFMLYYLIVTCIYTYSLWANFQFYRSNEKGLSVTISNRLSIMNRSKRFVLGHIAVDTFILSLEFLSFLDKSEAQILLAIPSYLQALRGVLGMCVILYSNAEDLTWQSLNPFYFASSAKDKNMVERVALEGLLQQPHLNTALRAEILYFCTQGIMFAAGSFGNSSSRDEETGGGAGGAAGSKKRQERGTAGGVGDSMGDDSEMYGFESHPTLGIRPSLVDDSFRSGGAGGYAQNAAPLGRGPVKPMGRSTNGGNSDHTAEGTAKETFADLSKFHKAQDEAIKSQREEAFMAEVEYLGLARGSVSFKGADQRHNSSSSASSPYAFHMSRPPHVSVLTGVAGPSSLLRKTQSLQGHGMGPGPGEGSTRNPLAAANSAPPAATRGQSAGWVRESELEMRNTIGSQHARMESEGSIDTVSTVKWRDTMDVEFTMGRADNGNKSAPDAWYRVPSASKGKRRNDIEEETASEANSDSTGTGRSNSTTPNIVARTLQNALSNAQSMFNPAFKEFRFKDFSPGYFAKVREMCSISPEEYSRSFEATCKETFSEGRSGAFMFFSSDQRCIAKSTSKAELLSLQKLMPKYVEYLTANPNSLLTRFLGAHCITMYGVELSFVVMLNCFPSRRLSERYDLKGSWVNRHALTKTQFTGGGVKHKDGVKSPMLYLDNDLQHKLSLQPGVAPLIVDQIYKDVEFLTAHKKMDYSLLIGVRKERFEVVTSSSSEALDAARDSVATLTVRNGRITDHALGRSMSAYGSPGMSASLMSASAAGASPSPSVKSPTMRVVSRNEEDDQDEDDDGGLLTRFVEGPAKYYIGIIDVLQEWNLQKQLERAIKVYIYRYDPFGISAMNPVDYSRRFLRRCVLETFEGLEESSPSFVSGNTQEDGSVTHSAAAAHGSILGRY